MQNDVNGYLVDTDDVEGFANLIERIYRIKILKEFGEKDRTSTKIFT